MRRVGHVRGECPVGGVKVSGYNTAVVGRHRAITGGQYTHWYARRAG